MKEWGHCDVPQKYAKIPKLGQWVKYHRSKYMLLKIRGVLSSVMKGYKNWKTWISMEL